MKKKRRYSKSFVIDIDIYRVQVMVCFGSKTDFKKAIERHTGKKSAKDITEGIEEDEVGRMVGVTNTGMAYVWVKDSPYLISGMGTLCHELLHAVIWIMNKKGLELTEASEEAYTYLFEYLVNEVQIRVEESEEKGGQE